MYCKHYGFKERPFNVTSDPSFFYSSKKHLEALSHLFYGVAQRKGIIVITGEIGTGKTTLCRYFLDEIKKNTKTAFILNPYLSRLQLFDAIVRDFGIDTDSRTRESFVEKFNDFLLSEAEKGTNVVLIIDEAQNLQPQQLEQIRLLSNLETEKDKLIQIVLVGQPELNEKLRLYELRQLSQRIMVKYHVTPLDKNEAVEYINHRLKVAGHIDGKVMFSDEALSIIADYSYGIPRLINIVCDRALLAGFVKDCETINADIINTCIQELGSYYCPTK